MTSQATNNVDGRKKYGPTDRQTNPEFMRKVVDIILKWNLDVQSSATPVVDFKLPADLKKEIDFAIGETSSDYSEQQVLDLIDNVMKYSVKTNSPNFYNQLFHNPDQYGVAAQWVLESMNTSQYTYEMAPVFTLMEAEVLGRLQAKAGFVNGDGIFVPGGSFGILYALDCARMKRFPEFRTKGMYGMRPLATFTSEQSHYSMQKMLICAGMGEETMFKVKCDGKGEMLIDDLLRCIKLAEEREMTPFFVNSTAGTTVLDGYDSLKELSRVCEDHDMWLHCDGAWGASVLFSEKHRHLMDGVHLADSLVWNSHKMLGIPMQCSAFLCNGRKADKELLLRAHQANAGYLFQPDKFYDIAMDTGDKSLQCGRKVDSFKLWLVWKLYGDQITFWYVPPCLRSMEKGSRYETLLGHVAPLIKKRFTMDGSLYLGYQSLGSLPNFWRMVVAAPDRGHDDMDYLLDTINKHGQDITIAMLEKMIEDPLCLRKQLIS